MVKTKIKDFNDAMLMDLANVGGIFKLKDSFEDSKKIDWFEKCNFCNYEWIETLWEDVVMDVNKERYVCKRTLITKSYVDWFINVCKAFFKHKIDITDLRLYESHNKDHPVLLKYDSLGMILAPRVDSDNKHRFTNIASKDKKEKKKPTS